MTALRETVLGPKMTAMSLVAMLCLSACGVEEIAPPAPEAAPVAASETLGAKSQPTAIPVANIAAEGDIVVNQHGFAPASHKRAALRRISATPVGFEITNGAGQVVHSGQSVPYGFDAGSGLRLHQLEFSDLRASGEGYRIRVGPKQSEPFSIMARPYAKLTADSLSYFYQMRAGQAVDAAFVPTTTPALSRPAGHVSETLTCFSGADLRGTNFPSCNHTQDVSGGWYDAGDYGKYAVNTSVSVWKLLNIAERQKRGKARNSTNDCASNLGDGSLAIPENNNGRNDLLDEARVGIEFMLSTQVNTTTPMSVMRGSQPSSGPLNLTQIDATDMVYHKVHGIRWAADNVAPAQDTIARRLYPPSTAATLHLAAIGAQCYRAYLNVDRAFANECLDAASRAYAAAKRVPDAYSYNNFTGGGPYDDTNLNDEFAWAATELWLATQAEVYVAEMERFMPTLPTDGGFGWQYVAPLAVMSLALPTKAPSARQTSAQATLQIMADNYVVEANQNGFAVPYASADYYWGSNGSHLNRAIILGAAHDLAANPDHKRAAVAVMDYLMGRNALSQSYITGYGETAFENPHHRFWAHSKSDAAPRPPAGLVSGGPNNTNMVDPVASRLRGTCIGQTCWEDDYDAYALNEIAINWNSSLVSVSHWLDSQDATCNATPPRTSDAQ